MQTPAEQRAPLGIGYVPQGREIFPQLTVEENLRMGLGVRGAAREIPEQVFELFPVLKKMLRRRGGDLSGGQQQQLAIGRALVLEPKLLILDEPTEGIQPNIVHEIGDIIIAAQRGRADRAAGRAEAAVRSPRGPHRSASWIAATQSPRGDVSRRAERQIWCGSTSSCETMVEPL